MRVVAVKTRGVHVIRVGLRPVCAQDHGTGGRVCAIRRKARTGETKTPHPQEGLHATTKGNV